MPKIVDPVARRELIVEAYLTTVCRDGVEGASLRRVADEAGLNIGSVRHYFDSAEELLTEAAKTMAARVEGRIRDHADRLEAALAAGRQDEAFGEVMAMLEQVLPLDETRRREATVWLAFTERSRTAPVLRPYAAELLLATREITRAVAADRPHPDEAAEALAACVDGLVLAAVHFPDIYPPQRQRAVLTHQLRSALGIG